MKACHLISLLIALCAFVGCADSEASVHAATTGDHYYTQGLMEPDKVASAWLIERHVRPGARVSLLTVDDPIPDGAVPFDLPWADWVRSATRSTYEAILEMERVEQPELRRIGELIRMGEILFWSLEDGSEAQRFDRRMKDLAVADDVEAMFAYLDAIAEAGGALPGVDTGPAPGNE